MGGLQLGVRCLTDWCLSLNVLEVLLVHVSCGITKTSLIYSDTIFEPIKLVLESPSIEIPNSTGCHICAVIS